MEKDIQRLEAENAELKDKLALAEAAAVEADQNATEQKIADLEAANTDLQTKVDALEGEKAGLTEQIGTLEAEKATLETKLATITAENKKLQMVQANAARKAKIEEVVGNKLEASAIAEMVTSWMFAEADGEISGRPDTEFDAFVAGLTNAVGLIATEPEKKESDLVTDPQNGGIGIAAGKAADETEKTAMEKLFDAI